MTPVDRLVADFSPAARSDAGRRLATSLGEHRARAHEAAVALATATSSSGYAYMRYGATFADGKRTPYVTAFPDIEPFLALLAEGDPGAIELAFHVLASIDPQAAVAPAQVLLPHEPWRGLGLSMGRALGRASSEASFTLLLDHPEVPYFRSGLGTNGYPGGVARAWTAWRSDQALPPRERAHGTVSEPLLRYLLVHDRAAAFPVLVAVQAEHDTLAAHFFRTDASPESRAHLRAALDRAPPGRSLSMVGRAALRRVIEDDPVIAIEALGGVQKLRAPEARHLRVALVDELLDDLFRQKPPRGWVDAMVGLPAVLLAARRDEPKEMARRAQDVWKALPLAVRKAAEKDEKASSGGRAKRVTPRSTHAPPDAALSSEMAGVRDALRRLVAHLTASGYRFVSPKSTLKTRSAADAKAIARLEKKLGPLPPVLAAFWSVVGSVDLRGDHPSWARRASLELKGATEPVWLTDPLMIAPAAQVIAEALEQHDDAPMPLRIAPDATGKAGYSGGALTIWLPGEADPIVDPGVRGPVHATLREHLRRAVEGGGMLGWDAVAERPNDWIAAAAAAARG